MATNNVYVIHRNVPGPRSADPRDRQIFRRVIQMRRLGVAVTLIAIERLPEGGAPCTLRDAGVKLVPAGRRTVSDTLRGLDSDDALLYCTTTSLSRSDREAILRWTGRVVFEVDHLRSMQLRTSRGVLAADEQPGIDTEIAHLVAIESQLLDRADRVIVPHHLVGLDVRATTPGVQPLVIAPVPKPPLPPRGEPEQLRADGHVVVPARFSDEWATPDEGSLRALEWLGSDLDDATRVWVAPEDAAPTMRRIARLGFTFAPLHQSAALCETASLALDLRSSGCATFARRYELSASGVPWLASATAAGCASVDEACDEFGALASAFVVDRTDAVSAYRALIDDWELRDEVAKVQAASFGLAEEQHNDALLREALSTAGLRTSHADGGLPAEQERTQGDVEYLRISPEGTLAAADPRIETLEAEMVPNRLFERNRSIDLQSTLDPDARYRLFASTHLEAAPANTPAECAHIGFSVLVPTYNTDPALLEECIQSVLEQGHANLELCIVDDGSTEKAHHEVIQRWVDSDERVKARFNAWNQGIAFASNDALSLATQEWIVLLDHDDVLKPDALGWCARYIAECPDYDLWYSDEDKILPDGSLGMPFFKPDWSPDFALGVNYVCHLLCVRHELVTEVGGFRGGFDGAQDFDLVLRLTEEVAKRGSRVGHIAKPLYSWRMIPGSTALDTGEKPQAHGAGHRALSDAMARRLEPATVRDGEYDTTHRIRYSVDTSQLLTIMIPTRDRVDLLSKCVERIAQTAAAVNYQILVIDNDSTDPATLAYLDELTAAGHEVVRYPHEFSFARQVNVGALHARGDLLLVLNNDTWPRNPDWLLRMMEHAQRPEVGLVGAKLVFPEGMRGGRPQHEGIVMGMAGLAYNIDLGGYMGMDQFVRDTSGVTAAAVMMRPSVLLAVGGMEERLRVAYNDVDFSLRVGEFGYRVVYTPHAVLEHPESASRGSLHPEPDEEFLVQRWGPKGAVREPFISPQLEWLMPVFYRL